jgi:hypothetical protein
MLAPDAAPVVTTSTSPGNTYRPNASTSTYTDPSKAYDATSIAQETFAYKTLSAVGGSTEIWSFASQAFTAGTLYVKYRLVGTALQSDAGSVGVGGVPATGFNATVSITMSLDGGATYPVSVAAFLGDSRSMPQAATGQATISGITNLTSLFVKANITYIWGSAPATLQIYDVRASTGSSATPFTMTEGVFYAYTEYDSDRGLESPASPVSPLSGGAVAGMVSASLALPSSADLKNSNTTHFKVYRTYDGGAQPNTLGGGQLVEPTATATTFVDQFIQWPFDQQPLPLLRLYEVSSARDGQLYFSIDAAPPTLKTLMAYGGGLVGSSREFPRVLRYSEPGYPESWPAINEISKLSLPERDEIVHMVAIENAILIACTQAMVILTDLPRVLDGTFNSAEAKPLRGQPGCTSQDALITYSVAGESRAVWVSRYGIHETNGVTSRRLTNSINWSDTVDTESLDTAVLHWNPDKLVIKFCYDSDGGGVNDEFILLHMAPEHQGDDGPKITGPFPASIYSICSGEVAGVYREYSGHTSNGTVYLEESTGAEPVTIQYGRVYGDGKWFRVTEGNLRHSDMPSETCVVTWSAGDDANDEEQTIANTVALDSRKGSRFYVNRAGEWHSFLIEYDGDVAGSFLDVRAQVAGTGKPGRIHV